MQKAVEAERSEAVDLSRSLRRRLTDASALELEVGDGQAAQTSRPGKWKQGSLMVDLEPWPLWAWTRVTRQDGGRGITRKPCAGIRDQIAAMSD